LNFVLSRRIISYEYEQLTRYFISNENAINAPTWGHSSSEYQKDLKTDQDPKKDHH